MKRAILIIEDNADNLYLMKYLLESEEYEVHWSETGAGGIEMAKQLLPAAILLDIQLPEMDGYEVARQLTALPELRQTPIVAVTSYAMVGDREKTLQSGAFAYMEKPIDPETFVEEITSYINQFKQQKGGSHEDTPD